MITTNIIEPGSIVEFIAEGECEFHEVLEVIRNQYGTISKGIVWNFNHATNANLGTSDMIRIAREVKERAVHQKTAYIASKDFEFGLLRMYESYAEMQSVTPVMKVFRDRDEAIRWITESA